MTVTLLVVVLSASPMTIAAPGLRSVNVKPEVASFFSDHLARELKAQKLNVVASEDIATLIGMERQKQLLGCSDEAAQSCLVELSNALGADAVLNGSIGRFEDITQLHLAIVDSKSAKTLATYDEKVTGSDKRVLESLSTGARSLARDLRKATGEPPPSVESNGSSVVRPATAIPAAAGLVGIGAGIAFRLSAVGKLNELKNPTRPHSFDEISATAEAAHLNETLSYAGFGLGALGIGTAVVLAITGAGADTSTALGPTFSRDSVGFAVAGSF